MAKGIKQNIRGCLFCGKTPLTEEELFPEWIRKIFPKYGPDKHTVENLIYDSKTYANTNYNITQKTFNKHVSRRTLKIVCADCNNVWMSGIESVAKSVLAPLILNQPFKISSKVYRLIGKWAVLRAIISESLHYEVSRSSTILNDVITKSDINKFYNVKKPFSGWYIWIGRREEGDLNYRYYRSSGRGLIATANADLDRRIDPPNTLAVIFGIKHLFVYVIYCPDLLMNYRLLNGLDEKFLQIFPRQSFSKRLINNLIHKQRDWKELPSVTDNDYINLEKNLDNNFEEYNQKVSEYRAYLKFVAANSGKK